MILGRDRELDHRLDHLAPRVKPGNRLLESAGSGTSPSRAKRASVSGMSRVDWLSAQCASMSRAAHTGVVGDSRIE